MGKSKEERKAGLRAQIRVLSTRQLDLGGLASEASDKELYDSAAGFWGEIVKLSNEEDILKEEYNKLLDRCKCCGQVIYGE